MPYAVIGTAGHVDHGKTTLVRALTGVDTDRLPDEKRRGISIDIGFAQIELPSGRRAAIVDVPGHERFIKNMVAGASGIDLCLLVVAADEGVMPQTREHLDIVGLLGVERGCVALTKTDTVDPEWIELVREELGAALKGTFLEGAPVVACSSTTGEGLDELRRTLDGLLAAPAVRDDTGPARLAVDRVFSVAGFGTVVTGTLASGAVAVDDRLEILPSGDPVRVRGLQVHGEAVQSAGAGRRTAVNLAGVERSDVRRGDVLATPGSLQAVRGLAARLRLLPGAPRPLKSGDRLHLHAGTAEVLARVTLLESDSLAPGASGFVQMRLEEPLAVARGDRYIVRSYSPVTTVGGGVVLEPGKRYKRFDRAGLERLALRERGGLRELVLAHAASPLPLPAAALAAAVGAPLEAVGEMARRLVAEGRLVALEDGAAYQDAPSYAALAGRAADALRAHHARFPLRAGMPREELRQALWPRLDARLSTALLTRLAADGVLQPAGDRLALAGRTVELSPKLAQAREALLATFGSAGLAPPTAAEALARAGISGDTAQELLFHLVETGELVRVDEELFFARGALDAAVAQVRAHLAEHGTVSVAELRDLLGTTRKYAVPLAEYLDRAHVTRRVGDVRRLA